MPPLPCLPRVYLSLQLVHTHPIHPSYLPSPLPTTTRSHRGQICRHRRLLLTPHVPFTPPTPIFSICLLPRLHLIFSATPFLFFSDGCGVTPHPLTLDVRGYARQADGWVVGRAEYAHGCTHTHTSVFMEIKRPTALRCVASRGVAL